MGGDFKAIVFPEHSGAALNNRVYAFEAFAAALSFMQSTKAATVVIEFSVETDTLDFYDAVKALKVPVIFSANRLGPPQFSQLGIREKDVVYPGRSTQSDSFADYRPRPGIRGSLSLITSNALFDV